METLTRIALLVKLLDFCITKQQKGGKKKTETSVRISKTQTQNGARTRNSSTPFDHTRGRNRKTRVEGTGKNTPKKTKIQEEMRTGGEGLNHAGSPALEIPKHLLDGARIVLRASVHGTAKLSSARIRRTTRRGVGIELVRGRIPRERERETAAEIEEERESGRE